MKEYAILLFRRYIIDMIGMCTVREICLIKRVSLLQRIASSGWCLNCQMLLTLILLIIQEWKILAQTPSFIECFGSHNWKIVPRLLLLGPSWTTRPLRVPCNVRLVLLLNSSDLMHIHLSVIYMMEGGTRKSQTFRETSSTNECLTVMLLTLLISCFGFFFHII